MRVRVATRRSLLARAQTRQVVERLHALRPGLSVEILEVETAGDRARELRFAEGVRGWFTRELEDALRDGRADVAVHSLKDLPVQPPSSLVVWPVSPRAERRDALVVRPGLPLGQGSLAMRLPSGARVGTSSPRRSAMLRYLRPDLCLVPLRGNVDTRLRRLEEGQVDAVVLAAAGLQRLGLADRAAGLFDPQELPPAPGQGAMAVQFRAGERALAELLSGLVDAREAALLVAERAVLASLGAGCSVPLGVWSGYTADGRLFVQATAVGETGEVRLTARAEGPAEHAQEVGEQAAASLVAQGVRGLMVGDPGTQGRDRGDG